MSTPIVPVLTAAGLAELANAQGTGLQATLAAVVVGRGVPGAGGVYVGWSPDSSATALKSLQATLPILSGRRRDPAGFTILSVLPAASPGSYPINEIGFVLSTGTLLAIWSDPAQKLADKTGLADVQLGFDLLLQQIPSSLLAITVLNPDVPDTAAVLAELLAAQANTFCWGMAVEDRHAAYTI